MRHWLILLFTIFFLPLSIFAAEPNNKYGIHLAQPHLNDLENTAELVNSNGGDWGYVTLVIQENDRDHAKWQDIFDRLREFRLIPIVRLATKPASAEASAGEAEGAYWHRPDKEDADSWVRFLDSLNWVVKNRYIVLFNEPNHATEWGGSVDAKSYAEVTAEFAKKLKEKNADFFMMLAGLDASAPSSIPKFEDEEVFLRRFLDESEKFLSRVNSSSEESSSSDTNSRKNFSASSSQNIFDYIDGWASHSYPNPGFSGSPWAYGRGTVRGYEWELELLGRLGIKKELPVFITETGWIRQNREEQRVAENYRIAFENVWGSDGRVMAVTPFVLDYQTDPFLGFSWKLPGEQIFYQQYYTVQSLSKIKGEPEQRESGKISFDLPKELVAYSTYQFSTMLQNKGQAIWDSKDSYQLSIISNQSASFEYLFSDIKNVKPFQEDAIDFYLKTTGVVGKNTLRVVLKKKDAAILETKDMVFEVVPLPSLKFQTTLFPKLKTGGSDFEMQVFDESESLVFKKSNVLVKEGKGEVKDIQNIILGKKYRVVILKPYYLPRQEFIVFKKNNNMVKFKSMLSLDFNRNGRGDWLDLTTLLRNPQLLKALIP